MDLYLSLLLPRRRNPLAGRIRATTARASCCGGGQRALLCCCTTICSAALQWEILTQMQTVVKYRYFTISPPPNTKYKYKFELCLTTICSAALYHLCCDCCDRWSWENRFSSGAPPARPRISHIIDVTTHCGQCHNIDFTAASVNCMIL